MDDLFFMKMALSQAVTAAEEGEVPVGAVIVYKGEVIALEHNRREQLRDSTAHAEMLAIKKACEYLGTWRLTGCTAFVTLEPCIMCAGALLNARIDRVVFGAGDATMGACGSLFSVNNFPTMYHHFEVVGGVLNDECALLIKEFFSKRRKEDKYKKREEKP